MAQKQPVSLLEILESQVFFVAVSSKNLGNRQDSKEAVVIDPLHELIRPTLTLLAELGLQLKFAALQRCSDFRETHGYPDVARVTLW